MSTDRFNIHEMGTGNDTHSNFLKRMGYGDLLNRPGRQEITLDTASMYKSAADTSTMLTGAGMATGGLAGNLLADYTNTGALGRLLMTVVGAGAGGVGGHILGKKLDVSDENGVPGSIKNRAAINAAALGSIGALAGYGTSKYLAGSKNNVYNTMGALTGGSIGALIGSHIAAPDEGEKAGETNAEAVKQADKLGLKGDQRISFIRDYVAATDREKDNEGVLDNIKSIYGSNPTEMDKVIAQYKGEDIPEESWWSWYKSPIMYTEGAAVPLAALVSGVKNKITGKTKWQDIPADIASYPMERLKWYANIPRKVSISYKQNAKGLNKAWAKSKPALSTLVRILSRGRVKF